MNMIKDDLIRDITNKFQFVKAEDFKTISDMLSASGQQFIFIFDEWDYIFNNNLFENHQNDFLEFLRNLLKDQPYVALAYMTGVLPIKKYSTGSALNMFDEFTMLDDLQYGDYFGFLEKEVLDLCSRQDKPSFEEISDWYNGYINEDGERIYNPRSVVKALANKKCRSYWTNTGAMDEEFRAGQKPPKTKEEIYSAFEVDEGTVSSFFS